ncbi:alpha/beta hydrolase family protein [Novipirellula artificiosorum]|uniref:Alpha/beta hydrolase family protein n=1 Tax=Novipirellula artificiosorum TaxID=2528016 RepID=A0A5C6DQY7_9BACT|nr:alpha/beta fold hydrolase [Novipirellula artificiosorum]TWU38594.1 Alpha/beta hydrolase family protein [Novipirellula artificiosorum]
MHYKSNHILKLPFTVPFLLFLLASGLAAGAEEDTQESRFQEHIVEFHNGDVRLAGSLLVPEGVSSCPAVVFVHGAGRNTRKQHQELGKYFASNGIAALIYDKRGTGESGGVYESHEPYKNLVDDALAAVDLLKQRPEIAQSQIGIWGLSQGAYISAAAASRTQDIKFVITAGASVADGSFFYYCDNLFRKHGLSDTLRDLAAKGHFVTRDLNETMQGGLSLSSFVPRSYPPPDQYLHPAWSHVTQPVLAMWGELDQIIPVGESVAGMRNSLAHANNDRWTMIILPNANHDLGLSETGELQSKWRGYAPGALKTMTDWARATLNDPSQIDAKKQVGVAPEAGILSRYASYEGLRWYGNATVQIALWVLFFTVFLINTIIILYRRLSRRSKPTLPGLGWPDRLKRMLSLLNFLIMIALTITILLVIDQIRPSCPTVLRFLPILGTVSTFATIAVVIGFATTRRDFDWTTTSKFWWSLDLLCLMLFVPYMLYWNLIGFHF